tara:strand:- start:554 stop:703 length:150 start_codon:yes stop_codon:yes gene_type:complete
MSEDQELQWALLTGTFILMLAACQQTFEPKIMQRAGIKLPVITALNSQK